MYANLKHGTLIIGHGGFLLNSFISSFVCVDELREYFAQYGTVKACRVAFVSMKAFFINDVSVLS